MYFKLLLGFLIIMLPLPVTATSDSSEIIKATRELALILGKSEHKKIDKAASLMEEAFQLLEKSKSTGKETEAKNILRQASEKYTSASGIMKDVYESALETFYKKASPIFINKFDHARYYDQKAEGYLEAASKVMLKMDSVKDIESYYNIYLTAYENVSFAIINELRAVKIYQDFPIEYPYDWDDFFRQHQIMLAREEATKYASNPEIKAQVEKEAKESFKMIYFRVQIAAHTIRIPVSELKSIYKGNLAIQELREDGWYKYSIGNFERYDQALDLLKSCQVRKAFIVAYDTNNVRQELKSLKK